MDLFHIPFVTSPSSFILRKVVSITPDATVSLTSAILHVRKEQVMMSSVLAIEKLSASGNNIKLIVPLKITNQRHVARVHVPTPISHLSMVKFLQNLHSLL